MAMPIISASATNLELSQERRALIEQKLAPLARLLRGERDVEMDVVVRRVQSRTGGDLFCVSAKLKTGDGTYMAVATGHYLTMALTGVREYLRRSLSRGESVATPFSYSHHRVY